MHNCSTAAVDGQVRAGDESRLVAGEKRHRRSDVVGRPEPTDRVDRLEVSTPVRVHVVRRTSDGDQTGIDAVDTNGRAEIERHRTRHPLNARLHCVVREHSGRRRDRLVRGDVDDRPAVVTSAVVAVRAHAQNGVFPTLPVRPKVGLHDELPVLDRRLVGARVGFDAGVD